MMEPEETNIIIANAAMNQETCTECYNYLSVGPIMISKTGYILCGRKNCPKDNYQDLRYSLSNLLVQNSFFHCNNFLDGCDAILHFNDVVEHENKCIKTKKTCYRCLFQGSLLQLFKHYENSHPELVVRDDTFEFSFEPFYDDIFFYNKYNTLFAVNVVLEENVLKMEVLNIKGRSGIKNYKIVISNREKPNFLYSSDPQEIAFNSDTFIWKPVELYRQHSSLEKQSFICKIILDHSETLENQQLQRNLRRHQAQLQSSSRKIAENESTVKQLMEELETKLEAVKVKETQLRRDVTLNSFKKFAAIVSPGFLKCTNCKNLITGEVFVCPQNHSHCRECLDCYCHKCQAICQWTSCHKMIENITFICDWSKCEKVVDIQSYLFHKQFCEFRTYKCPFADCDFSGVLKDFVDHWHSTVPSLIVSHKLFIKQKRFECYWLVDGSVNELFRVLVTMSDANLDIKVEEVSVVFPSSFTITLSAKGLGTQEDLGHLKQAGASKIISVPIAPVVALVLECVHTVYY